jgi:high-affinity iron transporter
VFANYLIGLREGLEAALVVSILVAFLVRSGRRDRLPAVAGGVAIAVVSSVAFGALLTYTGTTLLRATSDQEVFAGTLGVVAVGFVTWMVFWMKRTARSMRSALEGRMATALQLGAGAVALTAFLAVAREGLETALFLWSALQSAHDATPFTGAMLGIATAVLLAYLLYRSTVTLNLQKFFTYTGMGLVVVAGGVLGYSVHDLQEGGVVAGESSLAFDISEQLPPGSWYGALLKGVVNITPTTSWLQLAVHVSYIVIVMTLFLRGTNLLRRRKMSEGVTPTAVQAANPASGAAARV